MENVQSTDINNVLDISRNTVLESVSSFIRIAKDRKLSKYTIRSYESKLRAFTESTACPVYMDEVEPGLLKMFFELYTKKHKPSTVYSVFNVLRIFFDWFSYETGWDDNPFNKLRPPRVTSKIKDPVELATIEKMLLYSNTRWQSIQLFLLHSGCRAGEFLALDKSSVNMLNGSVFIKSAKGGKSRTVFIGQKAKKVLKKYLQERRDTNPALWVTTFGKRLSYSALNASLKRIAKKANVPAPNPHDYRRCYCLQMLKSGKIDLLSLSQLMGHSSTTTLRLYSKLTSSDLLSVYHQGGVDDWL